MKLTLIGMSTVGKSYWSERFEAAGFERIDLDGLIRDQLVAHIDNCQVQSHQDISDWLGLPDEPRYAENEKKLMQFEVEALKYAVSILENKPKNARVVVDTGGSLVYTPPQYWQLLKQFTPIIYLKMDKTIHQTLVDNYLRDPRWVIWNGCFDPQKGETLLETYSRCYSNLIKGREKLYEIYADYTLEYGIHRDRNMTVDAFLKLLKITAGERL